MHAVFKDKFPDEFDLPTAVKPNTQLMTEVLNDSLVCLLRKNPVSSTTEAALAGTVGKKTAGELQIFDATVEGLLTRRKNLQLSELNQSRRLF